MSNIILLLFLTGISYGGEIDKQNSKGHGTYQREPKQIVQIVGDGTQSNIEKAEGENLSLTGLPESNQADLKNQNKHVGVKSESSNIEKDHMLPKETKKLPPQNESNEKRNLKSGKKETTSFITVPHVMTVSTILMMIATWLIWRSNKLSNRILIAESRPIISFEVDRSTRPAWIIKNVGKGTALNVLVAHKQGDDVIERPIRNYNSLEPGKWLRIHWKTRPNIFIAQYQNVYGNNFTVECGESTNINQEGKIYKDWDSEQKKQLWRMIADGDVQVEHNQIHNQENAADS